MTRAAHLFWWLLLPVLALVGIWITVRNAHAFTFTTDRGYLTSVADIGKTTWFRVGFFLHVWGAIPVVFIGWPQFSKALQRHSLRLHRLLGKAYVFLILFAAAPGGLIIALGAAGGWPGRLCFVLMSTLWAFFTLRAWLRIRHRDLQGHKADMRRSYALTCAAITLRIWMALIGGYLQWRSPEAYALCAYLCWVPNLLLVEIYHLSLRQKARLS